MSHQLLGLVLPVLFLTSLGQEKAPPKLPPEAEKAQDVVHDFLKKLGGEPQLSWMNEPVLAKVFPNETFIVARYRIYPVARLVPDGYKPSNVFAVSNKEQKPRVLKNAALLEEFFVKHQVPVANSAGAKEALSAWLTIAQEQVQDGFYKFDVQEKAFSVEGDDAKLTVRGRALVTRGGSGEMTASLTYENGKLVRVVETSKITEGPRPID